MADSQVTRVGAVFDAWADAGRAEGMERGHEHAARIAFEALRLVPGQSYLDVGCGNGYSVRWAAAAVGADGQAVGLDLAPRMVARARAMSAEHANVRFEQAVFPEHPLAPGSFHAAFSMETLYYLPDPAAGLAAIGALLRPGGRFACVVDYYAENPASHGWPDDLDVGMTLWSMDEWRAAFEAAGMPVQEQRCIPQPPVLGKAPDWKQTQGSLLTLGQRP